MMEKPIEMDDLGVPLFSETSLKVQALLLVEKPLFENYQSVWIISQNRDEH